MIEARIPEAEDITNTDDMLRADLVTSPLPRGLDQFTNGAVRRRPLAHCVANGTGALLCPLPSRSVVDLGDL